MTGLQTSVIEDLTLQHPAAWRLVPVQNLAAGQSSAIAYLTDQPTVAQCQTTADANGGSVMTCG